VDTLNQLLPTEEQKQHAARDLQILDRVYTAFTNDGKVLAEKGATQISVRDLLGTKDIERFVPQVVTRILMEAREPNLLISTLFDHVKLERGQTIQIGAIGALTIHEVPETGEYKPVDLQLDSGEMVGLTVKKYGCLLQFTEEMVEDSQWDVMGLWIRAAGRAFARNREKRATQALAVHGEVVFDNADTVNAFAGGTTGRDIAGAANGSMTANDLFDMFAYLSMREFTPDTIIMHPLAWSMWATDPELKEIVLLNAQLTSRRMPSGTGDPGWPTMLGGMGTRTAGTGLGLGSTDPNAAALAQKIGSFGGTAQLSALGASFSVQPDFLPRPLTVMVTPFIAFSNAAKVSTTAVSTTTIVVLDSSAIGAFIEKTALSSEEFADPMRDIRNLKLRERWGLVLYQQGKGVAIAKNVVIAKNYVFLNTNSKSLSAINPRTDLVS